MASSVFVGNIPYDVTEEQLENLFKQFGDVVKFRLMEDSIGKGRGYGFCDFATVEAAESAKQQNNLLHVNGRQLRIGSATQPSAAGNSGGRYLTSSYHPGGASRQGRDLDDSLRMLTYGEVYDILVEVRAWVKKDPEGVKDFLKKRPVLAQALLKMQSRMSSMTSPPAANAPFSTTAPTPSSAQGTVQQQPQPYYAAQVDPGPTQPPQYTAGSLPGLAGQDYQQLLNRVLAMTEEEVAKLSPTEQAEVRSIRQSYYGQAQ